MRWSSSKLNLQMVCFASWWESFLQIKALGLYWDLNPETFITTHTQPCLSHLCFFDKKLIVKGDPTLHSSWEFRRAEFQTLDLNTSKSRKKDIRWMMNQDRRKHGSWLRMKRYESWLSIDQEETKTKFISISIS